jgi:hypothetical protein
MRGLILLLTLTTTPALAAEPYIGVWASSPAACKADPHKTDDAAIRISSKTVETGEASCQIKSRTVKGSAWSLKTACIEEGETSVVEFDSAHFTRCQDGDFQSITGD